MRERRVGKFLALASKHLAVSQPDHARATTPRGTCTAAEGLDAEAFRGFQLAGELFLLTSFFIEPRSNIRQASPNRSRFREPRCQGARSRYCGLLWKPCRSLPPPREALPSSYMCKHHRCPVFSTDLRKRGCRRIRSGSRCSDRPEQR